jgi:hypothetical protein
LLLALFAALPAHAQDRSETRELIGKMGTRSALLVLHRTERPNGGWQVAGEYVVLPTLSRRYLEGERSPELGVTVLKEGTTPILFGRPPVAELRGTWRDGVYKGTRYGPGGQKREDFEFSESFAPLDNYSARVRCEAKDGRHQARLALAVENGRLERLEWHSVDPEGQACNAVATGQEPLAGGLRFLAGACRITLRDAGEFVALRAENCASHCAPEADFVPLVIDRRGHCELLR